MPGGQVFSETTSPQSSQVPGAHKCLGEEVGQKVHPGTENRRELEVILPPEVSFFILYLVLGSPFWNFRYVLSRFFITLSRKGTPKPGLTT